MPLVLGSGPSWRYLMRSMTASIPRRRHELHLVCGTSTLPNIVGKTVADNTMVGVTPRHVTGVARQETNFQARGPEKPGRPGHVTVQAWRIISDEVSLASPIWSSV